MAKSDWDISTWTNIGSSHFLQSRYAYSSFSESDRLSGYGDYCLRIKNNPSGASISSSRYLCSNLQTDMPVSSRVLFRYDTGNPSFRVGLITRIETGESIGNDQFWYSFGYWGLSGANKLFIFTANQGSITNLDYLNSGTLAATSSFPFSSGQWYIIRMDTSVENLNVRIKCYISSAVGVADPPFIKLFDFTHRLEDVDIFNNGSFPIFTGALLLNEARDRAPAVTPYTGQAGFYVYSGGLIDEQMWLAYAEVKETTRDVLLL